MHKPTLSDRRQFPRMECSIPLRVSDYHFEWDARSLSLSNGGTFIQTSQDFSPGQDIEVTVIDEEFGQECVLEAQVRWVRSAGLGPHGIGVAFLERRAERLEILHDLVDRLAVADVATATRFRAASKPLPMDTILYVARSAPSSPVLTNEERQFLACVDGHSTLEDIKGQMPDLEFQIISYAPFSLLTKGILTLIEGHGIKKARRRVGGRAPQGPMFISGASRKQTQARNAQAQSYYQQALQSLQMNDKRKARTLLALALQLAPGDAEISAALNSLED
ncbi:MAG: PilZ domain-containing protein [Deltaproteobacteria bacterium]|nr:PilZ domain-containing protein [Deltaproteobacteria bacterium]